MRRERVPQRLTAGQRQDREYQTPPSHPLSLTVRALQNRGEGPHETGTDGLPAEPAQPQRERYGTPHLRLELHGGEAIGPGDRKSTRLNSSHGYISYAVFCLKKKKTKKAAVGSMESDA